MRFSKTEFRSTSTELHDLPQRLLWTNVIKHAAYCVRQKNDLHAVMFFKSKHFAQLCFYLKLDASSIRNKVLSQGFSNQTRVYKSVGLRSNS